MFPTICGRQRKSTMLGNHIAWASTVLTTTESFFGETVFEEAEKISNELAHKKIRDQVLKLNPTAQEKRIDKFIYGK